MPGCSVLWLVWFWLRPPMFIGAQWTLTQRCSHWSPHSSIKAGWAQLILSVFTIIICSQPAKCISGLFYQKLFLLSPCLTLNVMDPLQACETINCSQVQSQTSSSCWLSPVYLNTKYSHHNHRPTHSYQRAQSKSYCTTGWVKKLFSKWLTVNYAFFY